MRGTATLRFLAAAVGLALGAGCTTLPQPPHATSKLTTAETRAVKACHRTIGKLARRFTATALRNAGRCTDRAVELRLEEDTLFLDRDLSEVLAKRRLVHERCDADFARIGKESTKLIDGIVARCAPVQSLILTDGSRGDPLRLRTLDALFDAVGLEELHFETTPQYAALVCGESLRVMGELYFLLAPRISDAVEVILGMQMDEFQAYLRGFTDSRCVEIDG